MSGQGGATVETDAGSGFSTTDALRRVTELSERIREATLAVRAIVTERDQAIREAIDLYGASHRQVARASALSLGRVHGILAND